MDISERVAGILYGLAAGDRIGGPLRMALQLADSLIAKQAFDTQDVMARYVQWWLREGFDTGPVANQVFSMVARGMSVQDATRQTHLLFNSMTAGCNPAHRCASIALAGFITDADVADMARQDAALTHYDALAGDVAAQVAALYRCLVRGMDWDTALEQALTPATRQFIAQVTPDKLKAGGFAPDVLHAALYFVNQHADFEAALNAAIRFAGAANYCPVLVGALAGARYGRAAIPESALKHAAPLMPTIEAAAKQFAATFAE